MGASWRPEDYHDEALGPIGLADAYLLDAVCRYISPQCVVEYGGLEGKSLIVLAAHAGRIWCVDDIAAPALMTAAKSVGATVIKADMSVWNPIDAGVGVVDLVFFDAGHIYEEYLSAYDLITPLLTDDAVILVHDTADWPEDAQTTEHKTFASGRRIQLSENRRFVDALTGKGWSAVLLSSRKKLRHGITLLQRKPRW